MAENDTTTVQIEKDTLELIKELARLDLRSTPKEVRWLAEQERARRSADGIVGIQDFPGPEDADRPMLVTVRK